jgi:xanthine dehydrogenase YagT iron-sulfur-binding subunit
MDTNSISSAPSRPSIALSVNGEIHEFVVDPRSTLLDTLREILGLYGAKKGCDHGQCGSCTVLVDGRRMLACLILIASLDQRAVTTIEGIGDVGNLHPIQLAFLAHDAYQCGYCTPGQICSAVAMLDEVAMGWPSALSADLMEPGALDADEIRERMAGNLCRCGAYAQITPAIADATR